MHKKIIALLLTALVLPGLGHLYLGQRKKGALLLVVTNIFLLAALFLILPGIGKLLVASQMDAAAGTNLIAGWLESRGVAGKGFLVGFVVLWGFAIVDILTGKKDIGE